MAVRILTDANRCLQCRKPMCQEGCPIHTPIPQVIREFKENRLMEAGKMLFDNNPMSVICSIVCDHEAQCTGHCVLNHKGAPVTFYNIERFVSDAYLDRSKRKAKRSPSSAQALRVSLPPLSWPGTDMTSPCLMTTIRSAACWNTAFLISVFPRP